MTFGGGFGGGRGPTGPSGSGGTGPAGPTGAAGATGAANINATTNKILKATSSTAGGNSALTDDGSTITSTLPHTISLANLQATDVVGQVLANPTASTNVVTVQRSPISKLSGSAWTGSSTPMLGQWRLIPRTSGHLRFVLEYDYGGGLGEGASYETSEPNIGRSCWLSYTLCSSGGGFVFQDESGLSRYARGGNGALEVYSAHSGDPLMVLSEDGIRIAPRVSDGGPFVGFESGSAALNNTTAVLAASYTPADGATLVVEATFTVKSGTDRATIVRRRSFQVDAGTVAVTGATQTVGTDNVAVALTGLVPTLDTDGTDVQAKLAGLLAVTGTVGCSLRVVNFT